MTLVTNNNNNNNNDLHLHDHDEENNHGHGHEIILRSLPNDNEDEMPANHPKEEQPSGYARWRPWPWSRSRTLTAFLAAAGVGAAIAIAIAVGTGSVVFRAAGGNPSTSTTITSNMMQANVVAPEGYQEIGAGSCTDGRQNPYPIVTYYDIPTVGACATKCELCVAGDFTFVGMVHNPASGVSGYCGCLVNQTWSPSNPSAPRLDFSQFNSGTCKAIIANKSYFGTGPMSTTLRPFPGGTCYCREGQCPPPGDGGGSKAGKTSKATKSQRGDED